MLKKSIILIFITIFTTSAYGAYILIPMDESQTNHLKAYGVAYWVLQREIEVDWLLNYRGGSFMCKHNQAIEDECLVKNVKYQIIADVQASAILQDISDPSINMDVAKLFKAPKIAVYAPPNNLPWDDAVTLVLTYAEIPYDVVYDEEVLSGILPVYDWLHLHHEDFTGQYGKFWGHYQNTAWYREDVRLSEARAAKLGFSKVSQMKLAVAKEIKKFVMGGGFLFSMCSAPDSFDIALAAEGIDICDVMFDGDPMTPNAQEKLDFSKCFAFQNFKISQNPYEYEVSSIDIDEAKRPRQENDVFVLFDFSAKWDPVPTMLCQNHEQIIPGFMGQTTAFRKEYIKPEVLIMGENKGLNEAKYIHGEYGQGTWSFLGGHDPADYKHFVGDPPTDLSLHPNNSGYRLILNNILFPAAKKKKHKT